MKKKRRELGIQIVSTDKCCKDRRGVFLIEKLHSLKHDSEENLSSKKFSMYTTDDITVLRIESDHQLDRSDLSTYFVSQTINLVADLGT